MWCYGSEKSYQIDYRRQIFHSTLLVPTGLLKRTAKVGRDMDFQRFMHPKVLYTLRAAVEYLLGTILAGSGLFEGNDIIYATVPTQEHSSKIEMDYDWYSNRW
jgi:hypothetical protein